MDYDSELFEQMIPALTALLGVLITLLVQGFNERKRQEHESEIGKRVPLTSVCEDLFELLESQSRALTRLEAMVRGGTDVLNDENLEIVARKEYRKKLWAIVENPDMLESINNYAAAADSFSRKMILEKRQDKTVLDEITQARSCLGNALKTLTKHTAQVWGLATPSDKASS